MTKEEITKKIEKIEKEMMAEFDKYHVFESDGKTLDGGKKPMQKEIEDKYLPQLFEMYGLLKKFK